MTEHAVSARARKPIKGLRQRLRVALKAAGLKGRFRTDLLRGMPTIGGRAPTLLVVCHDTSIFDPSKDYPLEEFEGYKVSYMPASMPGSDDE